MRKFLPIGIGIVAIAYALHRASQNKVDNERKLHASEQFRAQARKAFDAISRCDEYRTKPISSFEPRFLEAQREMDTLRHDANGDVEHNIYTILFNYFLAVKRTRNDWENFTTAKKKELERDEAAKETAYLEAVRNL